MSQYNGTFMLVGGLQAPLYYVNPGLLNVQIPFELAPNRQYSILVSSNGALTVPQTIDVVGLQPGMAAYADGSVIAQHFPSYSLVNAASPAAPGESLVIYLVGMGPTNPSVASGNPTPLQSVPAMTQANGNGGWSARQCLICGTDAHRDWTLSDKLHGPGERKIGKLESGGHAKWGTGEYDDAAGRER